MIEIAIRADSAEHHIRWRAVPLLARIPGDRVSARLLVLTGDKQDMVREVAIVALEKRPGEAITTPASRN